MGNVTLMLNGGPQDGAEVPVGKEKIKEGSTYVYRHFHHLYQSYGPVHDVRDMCNLYMHYVGVDQGRC